MSRRTRAAPSAVPKPVVMSANYPNMIFLPNTSLFPTAHGNPGRAFNDQELGELAAENKAVLDYAVAFKTWSTDTDFLTSVAWPKVKLREGVQRVEGKVFQYDIVPTAPVPPRGTVRFMSKKTRAFSLAIGQKGIGSRFEGRALRSEYGPNLMAMEFQAYGESISLGMALNTSINLINAAYQYSRTATGPTYLNKGQEIAREIRHWCSLGLDPKRVAIIIGKMVSEKPDLDTLFVPDNFRDYMGEAQLPDPSERPILKWTMQSGQLVAVETPDRVVSITSLVNGKVAVYPFPTFRIGALQLSGLSTISRIGEVYPMYAEWNGEGTYYSKASLDIYLYDEKVDRREKLKFPAMVQHGGIWNFAKRTWSEEIKRYVVELNTRIRGGLDKGSMERVRPQWPLSPMSEELHLPAFVGNLSGYHLSTDDLEQRVLSVAAQLEAKGFNLAAAHDDLADIENLRKIIEEEPYNPAYWTEVIRLNMPRSVQRSSDDRVEFVGVMTSRERADAYGSEPVREWAPNKFGALDVPINHNPAGMWSAAGLRTIAETQDHPLADRARRTYDFFLTLANKSHDALVSSAIFNKDEMPVNMPADDTVQNVMTAVYGPRVPIFLAAPLSMLAEGAPLGGRPVTTMGSSAKEAPKSFYLGPNVLEGLKAGPQASAGTGAGQGDLFYIPREAAPRDGTLAWKSPSGVVLLLSERDVGALLGEGDLVITILDQDQLSRVQVSSATMPQFIQLKDFLLNNLRTLKDGNINAAVRALDQAVKIWGTDAQRASFISTITSTDRETVTAALKTWPIDVKRQKDALDNAAALRASSDVSGGSTVHRYRRLQEFSTRLQRAVTASQTAQPGTVFGKRYIVIEDNPALTTFLERQGYTVLEIANLGGDQEGLEPALAELRRRPVGRATGTLGETVLLDAQTRASGETEATVFDAARAQYYRAPMMMSRALLVTLARAQLPWILPADFDSHFARPANIRPDEQGNLTSDVYKLPHYLQSASQYPRQISDWHDTGALSRIALRSKSYASRASYGGSPGGVRSAAGLFEGSSFSTTRDVSVSARIPEAAKKNVGGGMVMNLQFVHQHYGGNAVLRFAALAYLFTPLQDGRAIIDMINKNVMPPFAIYGWRLRSDHEVAAFLLMKAGIDSGANFFNGAHFDWAQDATRDEYQTRVVITTDAHPIRPENHRLIPAVMPIAYLGGHNTSIVEHEQQLRNPSADKTPSIISTIVSLGTLRDQPRFVSPVSFIGQVPAEIGRDGSVSEPDRHGSQYFEGHAFYSQFVYPSIYGRLALDQVERSLTPSSVHYKADPQENHVAFLGDHLRWDYGQGQGKGHYSVHVQGDGHRADVRLNQPGARAYLNGETATIPAEKPAITFLHQ